MFSALSPLSLSLMTNIIKYLLVLLAFSACSQPAPAPQSLAVKPSTEIVAKPLRLGAECTEIYLPLLEDKTVGIIANQTSTIGTAHLVDSLVALGVNVKSVFAPEHGFRGNASAGAKIKDGIDDKTGLPILSLYGSNYKPSAKKLKGLDVVVFDIQDVGARFYTYISTMSHMMEACAENGISMLVLDRPNPNGHYVDGPILKKEFSSFVGLHEIPIVHGMTVGEYAKMVNGEGWLKNGVQCDLTVIEMENYNRNEAYELPIAPSPNLPNQKAIYLYPSLCFFEGTEVSEGRGTDKPFQQFGYPKMPNGNTKFTPKSIDGVAKYPKLENKKCNGIDLSEMPLDSLRNLKQINLAWLISTYQDYPKKDKFFKADFFDKLAGSSELRKQIIAGKSAEEIRDTWAEGLSQFEETRKKCLLYP
ncbi:MAG: exo-beta-N-acetylmuramidase NamZ family protein [Flavobacteriales bacterium]